MGKFGDADAIWGEQGAGQWSLWRAGAEGLDSGAEGRRLVRAHWGQRRTWRDAGSGHGQQVRTGG